MGFDADTCAVLLAIDAQSPDIAQGVNEGEGDFVEQGAGDQGLMFGYATDETEDCMPLTHLVATRLGKKLTDVRKDGSLWWLRPDGKTQVTVEYKQNSDGSVEPLKVHTVVIRALVLRGGGVIFCYLSISFSAVSRPNFTSKYSFFSIFQDLQDPHTFAPLHIQNLQIFSNFSLKNDEFSRFLQIFGEICSNLHFFAENFTDFYRNCGKC